MKKESKILCVFCGKPYTDKMLKAYNGTYGCETDCEYVTIYVTCENCGRDVYIKGEFGSFDNDEEEQEYLNEITEDDIRRAITSEHKA